MFTVWSLQAPNRRVTLPFNEQGHLKMATIKGSAPAKVNLTLHVTGQRTDGYHLLDSLVVFAGVFDNITATSAPELTLKVSGPFSHGIPADERNIVMKAARALQTAHGITNGAKITLEKNLPHAAGIGSGSSDAAVTLAMLADLWDVPPLKPNAPAVIALGADVPVCLQAPEPTRMTGIGENLSRIAALPDCAIILVNPMVSVPTAPVFEALPDKRNPNMGTPKAGMDYPAFCRWLAEQRNDLMAPALQIAPAVGDAMAALRRMPAVGYVGMSGSGATCFGLVRNVSDARQVARAIQLQNMGWWVAPAPIL